MRRITAGAILALILSSGAGLALGPPPPAGVLWQRLLDQVPHPQPASCCRVCHAGYACGNSCISRNRRCHQPRGSACDG
ncbi:MAG: hypothetical protein KDK12_03205 [Rhodobacteraceae bacterium]|nr:hypothetical protein [Paracoccaceae bacterium]